MFVFFFHAEDGIRDRHVTGVQTGALPISSKMLPLFFYRTFYETSVTLSSRVSKDTHVKHRERQRLKIQKGNAFQAVGEVNIRRGLTTPRMQRHLIWNKQRDPSSYISVFNNLSRSYFTGMRHLLTGYRTC